MGKLALLGGKRTVKRVHPWGVFADEEIGAISRALATAGGYDFGKDFAGAYAEYVGVKYALPVSNGTSALISALMGAGIGPGDEVIVPSFTWVASANCILHANGIPIFADVDPRTFNLDPEDVKKRITDRTKAIIAVDLYGHPAPLFELKSIAEENNLVLIEDAAQAVGAELKGKKLGSIAHITAFSFSGKNLNCFGGGMVVTDNREYYERAALAGQHPSMLSKIFTLEKYKKYASTGYFRGNFGMHPFISLLGSLRLPKLDEYNEIRIENANYLTEELKGIDGITPPYVVPEAKHVYHLYTCVYDEGKIGVPRFKFVEALNQEGLWTLTYVNSANYLFLPGGKPIFAGPVHHRAVYQELDVYGEGCPFRCPHGVTPTYEKGSLPVTEKLVDVEFNFYFLTPPNDLKVMKQYIQAIHKVLDNIDELKEAEIEPQLYPHEYRAEEKKVISRGTSRE